MQFYWNGKFQFFRGHYGEHIMGGVHCTVSLPVCCKSHSRPWQRLFWQNEIQTQGFVEHSYDICRLKPWKSWVNYCVVCVCAKIPFLLAVDAYFFKSLAILPIVSRFNQVPICQRKWCQGTFIITNFSIRNGNSCTKADFVQSFQAFPCLNIQDSSSNSLVINQFFHTISAV